MTRMGERSESLCMTKLSSSDIVVQLTVSSVFFLVCASQASSLMILVILLQGLNTVYYSLASRSVLMSRCQLQDLFV